VKLERRSPRICMLSKKAANHIGAIRYFICHDNFTRAAALPL
jgi:hypothetical protein